MGQRRLHGWPRRLPVAGASYCDSQPVSLAALQFQLHCALSERPFMADGGAAGVCCLEECGYAPERLRCCCCCPLLSAAVLRDTDRPAAVEFSAEQVQRAWFSARPRVAR